MTQVSHNRPTYHSVADMHTSVTKESPAAGQAGAAAGK